MAFKRRNLHITEELKQEISGARNIFDVFYSLTTDTPRGAYPLWTGEKITDCAHYYPQFYQKALEYRSSGAIRVVDNTTYENEVSRYGQCGAFVISGNDIRLPKITMHLKSFASPQNIGVTLPAGLPNITGNVNNVVKYKGGTLGGTDAFYDTGSTYMHSLHEHASATFYVRTLNIDASRSSSVYGASDTVQPPSVQIALYIQVYNHVAEVANFDVSKTEELIKSYYTTMDEKVNQAIADMRSQAGSIPDLTRKLYIPLNVKATSGNIESGTRTVYYIERPCWYFFWDQTAASSDSDTDQTIEYGSDIRYVCSTPCQPSNSSSKYDSEIVQVVRQYDPNYEGMCLYNPGAYLLPLVPGRYYTFSAGTYGSNNESPDDLNHTYLVPMMNSTYGLLAHKYSVKMNYVKRDQPLTYISHTDEGVINL